MTTWVWPIVFVALRLAVLTGVWTAARRFRHTHPVASRCVTAAVCFGVVSTLWGGLVGRAIVVSSSTGLFAPADELLEVLVSDPGPAIYLVSMLLGTTVAAIGNLLVAYAALAQPDRRKQGM
jgi:hypothetical protein